MLNGSGAWKQVLTKEELESIPEYPDFKVSFSVDKSGMNSYMATTRRGRNIEHITYLDVGRDVGIDEFKADVLREWSGEK